MELKIGQIVYAEHDDVNGCESLDSMGETACVVIEESASKQLLVVALEGTRERGDEKLDVGMCVWAFKPEVLGRLFATQQEATRFSIEKEVASCEKHLAHARKLLADFDSRSQL